MTKQGQGKSSAKRLARNAKKKHLEFAKDGAINSFGSKNKRRTIRKSKAKKKKDILTPEDCIKKADPDAIAVFVPEHGFCDFGLDARIIKNITTVGYTSPTPIQDQAIIPVMKGRDLIGLAQTGTGKTAAFLLPLIQNCLTQSKKRVLIVTPTRELALQIAQAYEDFTKECDLSHALVVGGANMHVQKTTLAQVPRFIIGTPGRLHDLVDQGALNLSDVTSVVIDEVDRMLDMGFLRELKYLLNLVRSDRQTLLFSATLKKEMRQIARAILTNPVTVAITPRPSSVNVAQDVLFVRYGDEKIEMLHDVLIAPEMRRVIIFVKTKFGVQVLGAELRDRGFDAEMMHGDLSQGARKRILADFKKGKTTILVATDIVARGIDVLDVTHVINYDVPDNYEDYVHRIGRTGRGDKMGHALTFWEKE